MDGVQDPGNVGTLVRAAAAFGASALVTSPGSADLFGPKTVRASMGALFALPVFAELQLADVVDQLPAVTVYGLTAHGGEALGASAPRAPRGARRRRRARRPLAHGLGARGPARHHPAGAAAAVAVESLNAGVAGAIALYEFSRRAAGAPEDPSRRSSAAQEG